MMARAAVRVGLALAALALGGCSTSVPTSPTGGTTGDHILVAFTSDRPPSRQFGSDIYFYEVGTGVGAVSPPNLNTTSLEGPCALSGDGKHLAFWSDRQPIGSNAVMFLYDTGSHVTTIPHWTNLLIEPQNPALSRDGRFLAVQYSPSGLFEAYISIEDLKGDSLLPVPSLNLPGNLTFDPALNGDASLVAFSSDRPGGLGNYDIYLYSVTGDSLISLPGLNSAYSELSPSISADGRFIAFQSGRPGGAGLIDVYLYDRQIHSLVPLPGANTTLADFVPSISPDGHYIAYTTESEGSRDIRIYDVRKQRLLELPGLNDPYFYDDYPVLSGY